MSQLQDGDGRRRLRTPTQRMLALNHCKRGGKGYLIPATNAVGPLAVRVRTSAK
jgi:hypothetical protein